MAGATSTIQPQWLTQKLDHQDFNNQATFNQLFYVNDTYWNPSDPIIMLMIGGEGPISPAYVSGHFYIGELAALHGALQVALEHRFYGQSVPNNDSSTENLKFLSSDQALEDLVTLHQYMTKTYGEAKWIVFGGSYSGSLSAWARLKYPNLFLGSFSASAPVQAELDFNQYFEVVAASVGPTCAASLAAAQQSINQAMETPSGVARLASVFGLCSAPVTSQDIANFMSDLTNPIAETVQYNDDAGRTAFDVTTIQALMQSDPDPLTAFVNLWNAYNQHTNQTTCTDISYTNYIASMASTSDARSWTWQTCTEFGYFQTGESSAQPFSPKISLDFYVDQCHDIFGLAGLTPNIGWINAFYGGNGIVTSNTVFTNGDVDPWHILGNYQSYDPSAASQAILIHGTAHCADMYAPDENDLPGLVQARETQDALLGDWLNQPSTKSRVPKTNQKAQ